MNVNANRGDRPADYVDRMLELLRAQQAYLFPEIRLLRRSWEPLQFSYLGHSSLDEDWERD